MDPDSDSSPDEALIEVIDLILNRSDSDSSDSDDGNPGADEIPGAPAEPAAP